MNLVGITRLALANRALGAVLVSGVVGVLVANPVAAAPSASSLTNQAFERQAAGDTAGAQAVINQMPVDEQQKVVALMSNVNKALTFPLTDQVPSGVAAGSTIVILGYGLENNGAMRPILTERLTKGLALAQAYPSFPVIVTGGNPKAGKTEAAAMREWLVTQGVPATRIYTEDRAGSTQANAINSAALMRQNGFGNGAVLVTSADHTRRSVADFLCAGVTLQAVVASDAKIQSAPMSASGVAAVYRDARGVAKL
ncbi:YdcF family protein [Tsukamurella sp. 8F]|uniref:YdcF family protein n=1 Tax=unclassified Tsukamurella TaxID=2633480 RepID=UPI0023B9B8CE|nr:MULTISPECIES: YdcF family protein [unclassified Tsukamurella]MDF0529251.1 YdcF family protein [Tsukamurella sp. 8J]MDF0585436.1 YdcF family protein [Tsukamurella sp. 8F]